MKKTILLFSIFCLAVISFSFKPESQTRTIVTKMLKAIETQKTCVYTMKSEERITSMKTGLRGGEILTKVNVSPKKVYMKMTTDPNKGTEILYVQGENNEKAVVNAGKMIPTLKLNPKSNLLTKDQHHTLLSAGFGLVLKIVGEGVRKADAQQKFDEVFKYGGDVTWNGRACYKLTIEDPTHTYTTYKANKGENMYSIAQKLLIPEYSLVELNGVKNFEEDLGGKTLKVPTTYAKKTIMYIDKENNLPIFQEMSDEKGIFERYSFYNVSANTPFKADEFTQDFSEYKF